VWVVVDDDKNAFFTECNVLFAIPLQHLIAPSFLLSLGKFVFVWQKSDFPTLQCTYNPENIDYYNSNNTDVRHISLLGKS
jgi:hypothetical protein